MITPLELLAPAGNADIGMAAIDHGADAVYIGAPKFSARAQAAVCMEDLARLIRHAHLFRAKVYVALNTILTDSELAESLAIIRDIYDLGADGLIIQDTGLLELDLPPIPLIASTQMHNDTPEKVRFLEAVGFQRVILARELSLGEIAAIRRHSTHIELEAFVHGALCVSYSGQCYMSQAVAGRSGNRGICAQPCRSYFTLTDAGGNILAQNKYLLSLKDMSRIKAIPDLIAAGVTSFKIEGRYKGIDYVKNVTAAYRQVLDAFITDHPGYLRASSGVHSFSFAPDVERTFNRGYTPYFLSVMQDKIASIHTQKSLGQPLGKITALGSDYFRMDRDDLQSGDGLCFFTRPGDLDGFRVQRVVAGNIYPGSMKGLACGIELYRNHDAAFQKALHQSSGNRRIAVDLQFTQDASVIRLSARDEDGHTVEISKPFPFEPANHPEQSGAQIKKQLTRTGNTPYLVTSLTINSPEPGFLAASVLNALRRDVLEALTKARLDGYLRHEIPFAPNNAPYPIRSLDYHANVTNSMARKFYERHGTIVVEPAFETLSDIAGKTVMTTRYCIRHQLDDCPKTLASATPHKEPLRLKDAHHTYRLEFDCRHCRMAVVLEK